MNYVKKVPLETENKTQNTHNQKWEIYNHIQRQIPR